MAKVIELFTVERRLYSPDSIPWSALALPSAVQRLKERFKFTSFEQGNTPEGTAQIIWTGGEFARRDKVHPVLQLTLQPCIIEFQIGGTAEEADEFYGSLVSFISEVDPEKRLPESSQYALTYQTIAIAQLSVESGSLFSRELLDYLRDVVKPALQLPDAEADIVWQQLSWSVKYREKTTDFVYRPKVLTIEPRAGSKATERLFYTVSPTDSKTHIALLEKLESTLSARAGS